MMRVHFLLLSISLFCLAATASAQTVPNSGARVTNAPLPTDTTADENYELNIVRRRIVESPFERSADLSLNDAQRTGIQLQVGFNVLAQQSAISLRGVFGNVRFRGSLEPLKNILARHRTTAVAPVVSQAVPQAVPKVTPQ